MRAHVGVVNVYSMSFLQTFGSKGQIQQISCSAASFVQCPTCRALVKSRVECCITNVSPHRCSGLESNASCAADSSLCREAGSVPSCACRMLAKRFVVCADAGVCGPPYRPERSQSRGADPGTNVGERMSSAAHLRQRLRAALHCAAVVCYGGLARVRFVVRSS